MAPQKKEWYQKLRSEHITWLSQTLLEQIYTLKEIIDLFQVKFSSCTIRFTEEELRVFAKENLVGWEETPIVEGLESAIIEQTKDINQSPELLSPEDLTKLNPITKHRRLLLENWNNYQALIKESSTNETAKAKYLDSVAKEVDIISNLESKEKNLLTMLDEVKKAEEVETPDQFRDYLEGYCLPKLASKAKELPKIKEQFDILKSKIDLCYKIMTESPNIEEGTRNFLKAIYTRPEDDPGVSSVKT